MTISGLDHTAHAPPVYASVRPSPAAPQHSVPGGGQPSRAGLPPAGLLRGLRCSYVIFPPPRLGLALQSTVDSRQWLRERRSLPKTPQSLRNEPVGPPSRNC